MSFCRLQYGGLTPTSLSLAAIDDARVAPVRALQPGGSALAREASLRSRSSGRVVLGGPDSDSGPA
eukprot:8102751-Pyramimonas_sp.AAC.1